MSDIGPITSQPQHRSEDRDEPAPHERDLETANQDLRHATEATRAYLATAESPLAGNGHRSDTGEFDEAQAEVIVEGEVMAFDAAGPRLPGETRVQHQGRLNTLAQQYGHDAQPDATPYVDDVAEDRRAHQRAHDRDDLTRE